MRNTQWKVEPVLVAGNTARRIGYRVSRIRDGEREILAEEVVLSGHPARFLDRARENMILAADRANVNRKYFKL